MTDTEEQIYTHLVLHQDGLLPAYLLLLQKETDVIGPNTLPDADPVAQPSHTNSSPAAEDQYFSFRRHCGLTQVHDDMVAC